MINNEQLKIIHLGEEFRNSIDLIKLGFGEIQNIGIDNAFYHLPLQLLSSGIERFLKCYICFGYYEQHQRFPDFNKMKSFAGRSGHDIIKLKEEILRNYFQIRHPKDLFLQADKDFIEQDIQLDELLYLLSEFGKYSRYHHLDIVTGKSNPSIDTEKLWEQFEDKALKKNTSMFKRFFSLEDLSKQESYDYINSVIISILERFIRGLSRQFTFVNLGELAKTYSVYIFDFIQLNDKDLGNSNYKTIKKETVLVTKKPYKRTESDDILRSRNPSHVYKNIKKEDYHHEWPFLTDEVIIECRNKYWCIITIDGYDYALNGAASDRFKLESINDSGMTIKGKSIYKFREMALALVKK